MPYATLQDLILRFGEDEVLQRTDRAGTGVIDETVAGRALGDADALIDGYLAKRYVLPFGTVPPLLTRIAGDVARYYLHDDQPQEAVTAGYKEAVRLLDALADGSMVINVPGAAPPTVDTGPAVLSSSAPRVFTTDTLRGF